MKARVCIELSTACNNACVFCAQAGQREHHDEAALRELLRAAAHDGLDVTFTGGEPTQHTYLPALIEFGKAQGIKHLGLQTNGSANPALLATLQAAGLCDVHVSVHGASEQVHDYHVGRTGAFAELHTFLATAQQLRITAVATTVLTRSNIRSLDPLPTWLREHNVKAWALAVPTVAGQAATDFTRVVPRIGLALPYALRTLRQANALGLPTTVVGAPHCALGPFRAHAVTQPRSFGTLCERCAAQPVCSGLDAAYLERFGSEELRALSVCEVANSGLPASLQNLFVGVGRLAQRVVESHPNPAAVRHRLSVLQRPQPAVAEVRGRATSDSDAAQKLFPALFEQPDPPR